MVSSAEAEDVDGNDDRQGDGDDIQERVVVEREVGYDGIVRGRVSGPGRVAGVVACVEISWVGFASTKTEA